MVLKYPENEEELVQIPSSDVNQTSSPPSSPNTFSQNELDLDSIRLGSDQGPFDFDDNAGPIPADLEPDSADEGSIPAVSTEFHPLINGMYIKYYIYYNF